MTGKSLTDMGFEPGKAENFEEVQSDQEQSEEDVSFAPQSLARASQSSFKEAATDLINDKAESHLIQTLLVDQPPLTYFEGLAPKDFAISENRYIYQAAMELVRSSHHIDSLTIRHYIEQNFDVNKDFDFDYAERFFDMPDAYKVPLKEDQSERSQIESYSKVLKDLSRRRKTVNFVSGIANKDFSKTPVDEGIALFENHLREIRDESNFNKPLTGKELITEVVDHVGRLEKMEDEFEGMRTGFSHLDEHLLGIAEGDLVVVAGRPSMGKTAFIISMIGNLVKQGYSGELFSKEMPALQIGTRLAAQLGKIDAEKFKKGNFQEEDYTKLAKVVYNLTEQDEKGNIDENETRFIVDDNVGLTVHEILERAKESQIVMGGLDYLVIDYLGLIQATNPRDGDAQSYAEITRELKKFALKNKTRVFLLAQLNREVESRNDKRPRMSDLRGSGAIEQDADLIVFLYRDEVYNADSDQKGVAEIIIGKHRSGSIGIVPLAFVSQYASFEDLSMHGTEYEY
jgi:replicative DNA helicase